MLQGSTIVEPYGQGNLPLLVCHRLQKRCYDCINVMTHHSDVRTFWRSRCPHRI